MEYLGDLSSYPTLAIGRYHADCPFLFRITRKLIQLSNFDVRIMLTRALSLWTRNFGALAVLVLCVLTSRLGNAHPGRLYRQGGSVVTLVKKKPYVPVLTCPLRRMEGVIPFVKVQYDAF